MSPSAVLTTKEILGILGQKGWLSGYRPDVMAHARCFVTIVNYVIQLLKN